MKEGPIAICIRCGAKKHSAWKTCGNCGLDPNGDTNDLIKSVYMSIGRYEDADERQAEWQRELEHIGNVINNGGFPEYEELELKRLNEQRIMIENTQLPSVTVILLKIFWPGIVFILIASAVAIYLNFAW